MTGDDRQADLRPGPAGALALLLALVTAGCAPYTAARYGSYGGPDAPLRARLASTFELSSRQPDVHFAVSDRAHVALFRVSFDGHARALYPYHPRSSSSVRPGPQTVYVPDLGHRSLRSPFASRRLFPPVPTGGIGRPATSFLMLVASREPLRLHRLRGEVPFRFRGATTLASPLQGGSAFGTMDRILARLLPAGLPERDWAVDWTHVSVRSPRSPLLLRRLAARPGPDADGGGDGADRGATDRRRLRPDSLPFSPPLVPDDLPEVTESGAERLRVPALPPLADLPTPRIERQPDHRAPSEHFGRLFGDGREEGRTWRRGGAGATGDGELRRPGRRWEERLDAWARDPAGHAFPAPPRRPVRRDGWSPGTPRDPGGLDIGPIPRTREPGRPIRRPGSRVPDRRSPARSPEVDAVGAGGEGRGAPERDPDVGGGPERESDGGGGGSSDGGGDDARS